MSTYILPRFGSANSDIQSDPKIDQAPSHLSKLSTMAVEDFGDCQVKIEEEGRPVSSHDFHVSNLEARIAEVENECTEILDEASVFAFKISSNKSAEENKRNKIIANALIDQYKMKQKLSKELRSQLSAQRNNA